MTANVLGALFYTGLCILLPIQFLSLVFAGHNLLATLMILLIPDSPHITIAQQRDETTAAAHSFAGSHVKIKVISEPCSSHHGWGGGSDEAG